MDNFFKQCPPMMSDGRLFTDYRTNIRANEFLKHQNSIVRDDEYRVFLQQNAKKLMDKTWANEKQTKSCRVNQCVHTYPTRMQPAWFIKERDQYNDYFYGDEKNSHPCQVFADYRL